MESFYAVVGVVTNNPDKGLYRGLKKVAGVRKMCLGRVVGDNTNNGVKAQTADCCMFRDSLDGPAAHRNPGPEKASREKTDRKPAQPSDRQVPVDVVHQRGGVL